MMRLPAEWFPEFAEKPDEIDDLYKEKRTIDKETYQFICLALSIKNRSALALTFRESAGSDDCWVHDVLGDYKELIKGNIRCCPK